MTSGEGTPQDGAQSGDSSDTERPGRSENGAESEATRALAPMDFSTFVLSLGSTAAVNLGEVPPPGSDQANPDLPAAKQIIDILGVLEEKTRGNLDDAEAKLLKSILYDLRVKYVDAQQKT